MNVVESHLAESVFSANPAKRRQAFSRLHTAMKNPLPAKHAVDKVQKHMDDPKLMTDLHHFAKHEPDMDMRPLIKKHMMRVATQRK